MSKVEDTPPSLYVVIPARLSSSRLPHKPLAHIGDRTMIQHVCLRAIKMCNSLDEAKWFQKTCVIVAADSQEVIRSVEGLGVSAVMTPSELQSGTDRVQWALAALKQAPQANDLVLNVQGDEPFFSATDVQKLLLHMRNFPSESMGTLAISKRDWTGFLSSGAVKVVRNLESHGIYFSRAPIPWPRNTLGGAGIEWFEGAAKKAKENHFEESHLFWHHLGIYAFRYFAIQQFAGKLPKGDLEFCESLEQLRALDAGWKIAVVEAFDEPLGVDTPEDLEKARARWKKEQIADK
jgi:3-deoxy-manno-octulosonate cytidylyltransferase (CMP-KDO synthetase)